MVSVDGLAVEFGGTTLFSDISFQINEKDRIALMGKNGAGKSTLLKILAGVRQPTRGRVTAPKDCVIAYLPQHLMTEDGRTVFEEASMAFSHLKEMEREIEVLNNELATRTDYESEDYMALIEKVATMSEKFYAIDLTHFEEDVEKALLGLGFERSDFTRPTSDFSGGWRMRIELAKLLLQDPDVLLLDEPTNHLDIESIQWLEHFLTESARAVVVISHDRKFVDNITTRTIEVTMGRIYDYKVNYSKYLELRKERREQQMKQYEEQQKMIQETKDYIERFKGTYSKTLQVQSRVKMLEKLQIIEVDEEDTSALRLKFPPSPRSGNYPVTMEDVGKRYGDHRVFGGVNLTVERGNKIAFVGRNGEGKSTLVKCIMGEIEHEGTLTLGHNVQIGYFAQNQASLLDGELTVFQTIDDVAQGEIRTKIRDLLGAFMFGGEDSTKKVKVLSGGERTRLALLKLLLNPVNLLILDEPTNHLDLKTKDILKQALVAFDGLIHITDLSWGRVNDPNEVVKLDEKLNVVILDFDDEKKRIALGLKQLQPHPWDALDPNLKVGDKVKGKVVVMADYGAFVEIAPGVEGLIHVSEMSWSQHLRSAQDFMKVGDEVEAVVLTLDRKERKMSLGIKQLKADPWANIEEKYPVGSKHTAKVRNFTNFGVFVELEEGVDGLIHISDLSWTKKIKHPSEFTQIGADIDVQVLEIDKDNRRLSLGHKQLEENPWDVFETIFTVGSIHEGTIVEMLEKGAVIALPYGVEGFATPKHLVKEDGTQAQVDEKLNFKVIEFNKDSKRIILSHSRIFEDEARAEKAEAKKAAKKAKVAEEAPVMSTPIEKTTLGDISALAALKEKLAKEGK